MCNDVCVCACTHECVSVGELGVHDCSFEVKDDVKNELVLGISCISAINRYLW